MALYKCVYYYYYYYNLILSVKIEEKEVDFTLLHTFTKSMHLCELTIILNVY